MDERETTIVIADDEASVRELLKRIVGEAGYQVYLAADGREALELVSTYRPSLVLLDIKMPGMSGIEVLQQIGMNWPDTCVVMATAVVETQTAVEAMKLGAYDYLTKPFNRDEVLLTITRALEKKALEIENDRHKRELESRISEQTERLQQQFVELVETLAREQKLLYKLAYTDPKHAKEVLSKLPRELQTPMSSVEEFSEALIRILRRGKI